MPPAITNRTGQIYQPVLTNLAREFKPSGFIADMLVPEIPVENEAGQYVEWETRASFANDVETLTPDRAETREVDLTFALAPYIAEEHALKASVSDRERRNAQVDVRRRKVALLENRHALAKEIRVANLLTPADYGVGGGLDNSMDATPSVNWSHADATIEADILSAKEAIYDATGIEPNTIVIPYKVANQIAIQPDIREIFKYTVDGRQLIGAGANILPPELWGLKVLIPRGRRATNALGAADAFGDIWDDHARILFVQPSANMEEPSVAYRFKVRGTEAVTTWRENDPQVEWVRNSKGILVEKVTAPFCGYVLKDLLA